MLGGVLGLAYRLHKIIPNTEFVISLSAAWGRIHALANASLTGLITTAVLERTISLSSNINLNFAAKVTILTLAISGLTGCLGVSENDQLFGVFAPVVLEPSAARLDDLGTKRIAERKNNDTREPGFIDFADQGSSINLEDSYIEWRDLDLPASRYDITIRYANGRSASRDLDILINGASETVQKMSRTGADWDEWADKKFRIEVDQTLQTLTLRPTASAGGPNIDYVVLQDLSASPTLPSGNELPVEVLGPEGTAASRTFSLDDPGAAVTLSLECHRCGYRDRRFDGDNNIHKASVQINDGQPIRLKYYTGGNRVIGNTDLELESPAAEFGGIGGAHATVRMTMPIDGLVAGENTITFRHVDQRGGSIGFRILSISVQDAQGNNLLDPATFGETDPSTWTAPVEANTQADIDEGKRLWRQNNLLHDPVIDDLSERIGGASNLDGKIWASCADCHVASGWDLEYFNYSNNSIIARSVFHGLSDQQGRQIAAYIRTLPDVPYAERGRPWNPPFQPGPGINDDKPDQWAAGAGLDAVLQEDKEMREHLFPRSNPSDQEVAQVASRLGTLNMRRLPVAVQMPDWNGWLPAVHPRDAFNANASAMRRNGKAVWDDLYDTARNDPTERHLGDLVYELAEWMKRNEGGGKCYSSGSGNPGEGGGPGWRNLNSPAIQAVTLGDVIPLDGEGCRSRRGQERYAWPAEMAKAGLHSWAMTKLVELIHTNGLQTRSRDQSSIQLRTGERVNPSEGLGWVTTARSSRAHDVFTRSPHYVSFNQTHFFDQDKKVGQMETTIWYYLQLVLNAGHRRTAPSHFTYTIGNLEDGVQATGVPASFRFWASLIKQRQVQTNGRYGVEEGLDLRTAQPYIYYSDERGVTDIRAGVGRTLWRQLADALLLDFVKDAERATNNEWDRASQNRKVQSRSHGVPDDPRTSDGGRMFGRVAWQGNNTHAAIPLFRSLGVRQSTLDRLIGWGESVWSNGRWDRVR